MHTTKNKRPLLVNIVGVAFSGTTTACGRIERFLNSHGIKTVVSAPKSASDVLRFEDNLVMGKYTNTDVVLFDKHWNVASAARQRLRNPLWHDESVLPDISCLMHCDIDTYHKRYPKRLKPESLDANLNTFLLMSDGHFGTANHHVLDTQGNHGRVFAAGKIKNLILKELG